jgi:hypothetical protein
MSRLLDVLRRCFTHNRHTFPINVEPGQRRLDATGVTAQVLLNTNQIRLQKAVLCANCEVITEGRNGHCACCGSQSLLSLSRALGKTIEQEQSYGFATSAHAVCHDVSVSSLSAAVTH